MEFKLTPAQFSTLEEKLSVQPGITLSAGSAEAGTILTHDVTLAYAYDGAEKLTVTVIAKHSMKARFASDAEIESKIQELFTQETA